MISVSSGIPQKARSRFARGSLCMSNFFDFPEDRGVRAIVRPAIW